VREKCGFLWSCRAFCAFQRGDYRAAVRACRMAAELNPSLVDAYVTCGAALQRIGDLDEALCWYDRAICVNPRAERAFVNRAALRTLRNELEAARADLESAFQLGGGQSVSFWLNRAFYYNASSMHERALNDCTHVLEVMRVASPQALTHRGYARLCLEQFDEAAQDLDEAVRAKPDLVRALYYRALLSHRNGITAAALKDLTQALRLISENDAANAHLLQPCQQLFEQLSLEKKEDTQEQQQQQQQQQKDKQQQQQDEQEQQQDKQEQKQDNKQDQHEDYIEAH